MSNEKKPKKKKPQQVGASPTGEAANKKSISEGVFWGGLLVLVASKLRK